eukprot:g1114.t1
MDVSVTATGVDVRVQIDEDGSVVCAALSDVTGACTADIELLQEYSNSSCNVTRSDCIHCDPPSFGCITRSSMWVDDGCSGRFWLEGAEVDCQSSELDTTIHDAAFASVLSVGHRHACALRKEDRAAVCWGKADYIDPVTFSAPAGSFKSIAAGYVHTCAVDEATELITCWGSDLHGETAGPGGISTFDYVTSGYQFSCALRSSDHKAECWGLDDSGQASPPDVAFLTISAGYRHVCGIQLADYQILCWGLNDSRSCHYHTCGLHQVLAGQGPGLVKNGTVRCWGLDTFGQSSPYSATSTPSVGFGGIALDDDYSCGLCFDGDEFENVTCQSDSAASSQRIKGISGARDASASASLVYESTVGYAEAFLTLTGLSEGSTYGIYCTVEDDEVPVLNVLSNSDLVKQHANDGRRRAVQAAQGVEEPELVEHGPLPVEALTQALRTACPELLGDRTWLHLLQPLCSSPPPDAAADGVLAAVARRPALAGCAAVWAAALGRRALAVELQAMAPTEPRPAVLRSMEETGNVEQFFEDVLEGRLVSVILHLARGVTVEATGPAIHRNDVGCCRWTPLAAAADSAARRTQGESVRFLLFEAYRLLD